MSTELQVLIRAREMVASGWVKGSAYGDGHRQRCAGQAITDAYLEVTGKEPGGGGSPCMCGSCHHAPWDDFNRTVEAYTTVIGCPSIPTWNDAPDRTHGEVLRAFDRTIERLQQREPEVKVIEVPVVKAGWNPIFMEDQVVPESKIEKVTIEAPKVGMIETSKKKVLELLGV